jgi:sensor histidine kinase YesM
VGYWIAQGLFWGTMAAISIAATATWGTVYSSAVTIPILLCSLCLLATHALRLGYHRYGQGLSLPGLILVLIIALPVTALLIQSFLFVLFSVVVERLPVLFNGFVAYRWSYFLAYVGNTTVLLGLWTALYLMVSQFRRRQQTQAAYWQTQAQLRDAELQFLHSQINSHFLFNAINNLRSLIREDPEAARDGLTQLADTLRAVLQAGSQSQISVGKELELVRAYLALERLQLESRLQVEWTVDDNCLESMIPPLLIQTLVENAISHGIACRPDGGLLEIFGLCDNAGLTIRVTNPVAESPATRQGSGIGLSNARRRLESLFGDRAQFNLQEDNNKMIVTVLIQP